MTITVEVVSDLVCPWCYLGKRRLERAIEQFSTEGGGDVEVRWRPFELDPSVPAEGVDAQRYLEVKFGGVERGRELYAKMERLAASEGLEYHFDRHTVRPNTIASHRVVDLAERIGGPELQDAVVEALFAAFFTGGRDLGDAEVLAEVASDAGLDRESVFAELADDAGAQRVAEQIEWAYDQGVTGVPFFVVGDDEGGQRYGLPGAQEPEVIVEALRRVAAS
jgi:predicted DsbA family dithiol-disulfide isomerase